MSVDQPRVLVVEDEPAQREVLAYNLEAENVTFRHDHAAHNKFKIVLALQMKARVKD